VKEKLSFSDLFWIGLIILIGLFLRWYDLDIRPVHHDESLHLYYSRKLYDNATVDFYKYDPLLHGTVLYYWTAFFFHLFGPTTWGGRALTATLGSALMLAPLLLRHLISKRLLITLLWLIAFSPSLIYWSRFLREDLGVIFALSLGIWGVFLAPHPLKGITVGVAIGLHLAAKENFFVHLCVIVAYLFFESSVLTFFKSKNPSYGSKFLRYFINYRIPSFAGFVAYLLTFKTFASSFFYNSAGPLDVLFRKSLPYWWEHHSKERIVGPFVFHALVLSWYEVVILGLILATFTYSFIKEGGIWLKVFGAVLLGTIGIVNFLPLEIVTGNEIFTFLKLKGSGDLGLAFLLLTFSPLVTIMHLYRGEQLIALTAYGASSIFFSYSYLGEKVPWLTMYPLFFGILYLGVYAHQNDILGKLEKSLSSSRLLYLVGAPAIILMFIGLLSLEKDISPFSFWCLSFGLFLALIGLIDDWLRLVPQVNVIRGLSVIGVGISLYHALLINFSRGGAATEFISQVHTTKEASDMSAEIRKVIESKLGSSKSVQLSGEATWPLVWYFYDVNGYHFANSPEIDKDFTFVIADTDKINSGAENYHRQKFNLRGWWVPDYQSMTWKNFFYYMFFHVPWQSAPGIDSTGYSTAEILTRKSE
jgi:uncharacterized protein (TIGR03663 family)